MSIDICEVCLKSDMLCPACQKLVDEGKISKLELSIARFLHSTRAENPSAKDVKIIEIIESDGIVTIVTRKGDAGKIIGKSGKFIKRLSEKLNKRVKVLEQGADIKSTIQSAILPLTLLGINVAYTPAGEKIKVRISASQLRHSPVRLEEIRNTLKMVLKRDIEIIKE